MVKSPKSSNISMMEIKPFDVGKNGRREIDEDYDTNVVGITWFALTVAVLGEWFYVKLYLSDISVYIEEKALVWKESNKSGILFVSADQYVEVPVDKD
ncbi:hypothetical protein FQA39_LY15605 [Lamprigera yunnana]|nr:hypothetical protein FQA39_LY15605 [Lamprigera yunnana]